MVGGNKFSNLDVGWHDWKKKTTCFGARGQVNQSGGYFDHLEKNISSFFGRALIIRNENIAGLGWVAKKLLQVQWLSPSPMPRSQRNQKKMCQVRTRVLQLCLSLVKVTVNNMLTFFPDELLHKINIIFKVWKYFPTEHFVKMWQYAFICTLHSKY